MKPNHAQQRPIVDRQPHQVCGTVLVLGTALLLGACAGRSSAPAQPPETPQLPGAATTAGADQAAATTTQEPVGDATAVALATARAAKDLPVPESAFGTPGIAPGELMLPVDVDLDDEGNIYVSDSKGVQRFGPDGTFRNLVGASVLKVAAGIAVAGDGTVYVTGMGPVVHIFDAQGEPKGTIGQEGDAPGQLRRPVDVALDAAGDVYVIDAQSRRIERYSPAGAYRQTIGGGLAGQPVLDSPRVLAIDGQGRLYVGMGDDYLIQMLSGDGQHLDTFGKSYAEESMWRTGGLALDERGRLYASRNVGHSIQAFSVGDTPTWLWDYGQLGSELGQFNSPSGMACRGNVLYVADTANHRIQILRLAE